MTEENQKEMMEDKRELKEIELDKLEISDANVRKLNAEKETESLAETMRREGLHHPIEVRWNVEKEKFEVINGQRRTIAARKLGWTKIKAFILPETMPKNEDIIRSLSENINRLDIDPRDRANAIRKILDMYNGDWLIISDILNRSVAELKKWEEYGNIPEEIKEMVTQKKLTQGAARDLAKFSKTDPAELVNIARQISEVEKNKDGKEKRVKIIEYIKRKPETSTEEIYEKFIATTKIEEELPLSVNVEFNPRLARAIKNISEKRNESPKQFITSVTREWLEGKGLLQD